MLAVCVYQLYLATQVLRAKCLKSAQKTATSAGNMCSRFTDRDVFIALVCLTIILLGVGHLIVTHDLLPRRIYRDAELEEARMYDRNMSMPRGRSRDRNYVCVRLEII
jgi:hypothetical protein